MTYKRNCSNDDMFESMIFIICFYVVVIRILLVLCVVCVCVLFFFLYTNTSASQIFLPKKFRKKQIRILYLKRIFFSYPLQVPITSIYKKI